jgi:hypothetical protein
MNHQSDEGLFCANFHFGAKAPFNVISGLTFPTSKPYTAGPRPRCGCARSVYDVVRLPVIAASGGAELLDLEFSSHGTPFHICRRGGLLQFQP